MALFLLLRTDLFNDDVSQTDQEGQGSPIAFEVGCTQKVEYSGVIIEGQDCPEDRNQDGYADTNSYVLSFQNTTSQTWYFKYTDRSRNDQPGDREYLVLAPQSNTSLRIDLISSSIPIKDIPALSRTYSLLGSLEIPGGFDNESVTLNCPPPSTPAFPFAVTQDQQQLKDWNITLQCEYSSDTLAFEQSRLLATPNPQTRSILCVSKLDEFDNTVVYQFESKLGTFILDSESIQLEVYYESQ